jgi:hypothetical protein
MINAFYVMYLQGKTSSICQDYDHNEPNYPPIHKGIIKEGEAQ